MQEEEKKKHTKGIEHAKGTKINDVIGISVIGFIISGFTRSCYSRNDVVFDFCKASAGAVIAAGGVVLGAVPEMFVGFLIYENQGALLGAVAGNSIYSAMGTLIGGVASVLTIMREPNSTILREIVDGNFARKTYSVAMIGAVIGFIAEQASNVEESIYKMLSAENINIRLIANYADNYLDFNYIE
jgi:hypothetical protein